MDSRHLETLVWVTRLGGIGAAAQHLNLTQPAITRRMSWNVTSCHKSIEYVCLPISK